MYKAQVHSLSIIYLTLNCSRQKFAFNKHQVYRKQTKKPKQKSTHSFGLASTGGGSFVGESKTAEDGMVLSPCGLLLIIPFTPWMGWMPFVFSSEELSCSWRAVTPDFNSVLFIWWLSVCFLGGSSRELISAGGRGGKWWKSSLLGSLVSNPWLELSELAKRSKKECLSDKSWASTWYIHAVFSVCWRWDLFGSVQIFF